MHWIYAGLGWGMIALGVVHITAATRFYDHLSQDALWFVSGGLAMLLTGLLNLLNRSYGRLAPGLRRACSAATLVMTAFALLSGLLGGASLGELLIVVGLFGGATALSMLPSVLLHRGAA